MIEKLKSLFSSLTSQECSIDYAEENRSFDVSCSPIKDTKIIGYCLILTALFMKLPQIHKIYSKKSAKGLNILSILLELFNSTGHVAYCVDKKFFFSEWGDSFFNGVQTVIVAALTFHFNHSAFSAFGFLLGYGALSYILIGGVTPSYYLFLVESSLLPILTAGKLLQAWTNYKSKSTAQLSAISWIILLVSSILRVYTTAKETGDALVVASYVLSTVLNGFIVMQFWIYRGRPKPKTSKETKKDKKKTS
uniref:Solute carrier family 66 member 3 n=1 Tax=Tabanus bromius TaxID=304241 RepID=A0A0K8TQH4_TABBR